MTYKRDSCVIDDGFIPFTESAKFKGKCQFTCRTNNTKWVTPKPLKCACKDNWNNTKRVCDWMNIDNEVKAFGKGFMKKQGTVKPRTDV